MILCGGCGRRFKPGRRNQRYCTTTCRVNAHRARKAAEVLAVDPELPRVARRAPVVGDGPVTAATLARLEEVGRLDGPAGRAAVALARRLDGSQLDTGSAMAAVAREFRAALEEAVRGAPVPGDGVDELAARRQARRVGLG